MKVIVIIYKFFLSLRYNVKLKNLDVLKNNKPKLFLSNHQAIVDPQIVFTQLYNLVPIIPVVTESYFKIPLVKNVLKMIKAVPVSDLSVGTRDINVLNTVKSKVIFSLKNKKSILLYPSGQIIDSGLEKIKNKKSAFAIVSEIPDDVQIIAVSISGLWGSTWSKAINGKSPKFFNVFLKSIIIVFANFVFFVPKRIVKIELIDVTNELKSKINKKEFNTYLENIFNNGICDIPLKIRHFFYLCK